MEDDEYLAGDAVRSAEVGGATRSASVAPHSQSLSWVPEAARERLSQSAGGVRGHSPLALEPDPPSVAATNCGIHPQLTPFGRELLLSNVNTGGMQPRPGPNQQVKRSFTQNKSVQLAASQSADTVKLKFITLRQKGL